MPPRQGRRGWREKYFVNPDPKLVSGSGSQISILGPNPDFWPKHMGLDILRLIFKIFKYIIFKRHRT